MDRYLPETMEKGRDPGVWAVEMRLTDELVRAAYLARNMGMDTGDWLRFQAHAWNYVNQGLTQGPSSDTLETEGKRDE